MAKLSRSNFSNQPKRNTMELDVPEWGGSVLIQELSAAEKSKFQKTVTTGKGKDKDVELYGLQAKFLVLCLVDEEGKRLFADNEFEMLNNQTASSVDRVFNEARKFNGMTAEAVEELEKN